MERPDSQQALQRVKVGAIGLAAVVLLIALASAIIGSATRERPVGGAAQANIVAEIAQTNTEAPDGEPLAEMGVAPGAGNSQEPAAK